MDYHKLFESDISSEAAKKWRAEGKKALGVICCHIPEEIFYAAEVLPVRMRATNCVDSSEAEMWMSSFSCSFAKSILQYWLDGTYELDGFVASDGCLQAARIYDNARYINEREGNGQFIMQIGAPRKNTPRTVAFYREELADLIAGLEQLTGNKITDEKLTAAIKRHNEVRALVAELYALRLSDRPVINGEDTLKIMLSATNMPIDEYAVLLRAFLDEAKNRPALSDHRARIMVIGSALDNPEYLRVIESQGALVVADALCFGQRGFGAPMEVDENDVLGSIAAYYLKRLVCPRMMDKHEELHDYILSTVREYKADGVIYERMQNCEVWGGENVLLERKLKDANIPLLTVEREEIMANAGQLAVRAEAFVEMIEKED